MCSVSFPLPTWLIHLKSIIYSKKRFYFAIQQCKSGLHKRSISCLLLLYHPTNCLQLFFINQLSNLPILISLKKAAHFINISDFKEDIWYDVKKNCGVRLFMIREANKTDLKEILQLYLYLHETNIPEDSEH